MRDQLISTDGGEKTQLSQTAVLGNHFSSIAQLNACGNLQMTELSSWEGGGRVRQKVFLCLVLTSGKPNYHQHSSGLCRSIRRPTPPKTLHIIVGTKSWFLFLSAWWSVSCRAVWIWDREKVKTGELSIHRGVRFEKSKTYSGVRSTQYGDLTLFANNSGLCAGILQHVIYENKQRRGNQKGTYAYQDGWHDVLVHVAILSMSG